MAEPEVSTIQDPSDLMLARLLKSHESYFNVESPYELAGRKFAGFGQFHADSMQYVLIKRAKLWEAHTHEYLFFHQTDHLSTEELDELVNFMTGPAKSLVDAEPNHMTSFLSLVILARAVDDGVADKARHTRWRQHIAFGWRGWMDLRLAVVDLANREITTNGQGKALHSTLEANLI